MTTRSQKWSKRIGTKPFSGRRFVEAGKVRIEWWPPQRVEDAGSSRVVRKRQARTIGDNTPETRRSADTILEKALAKARAEAEGLATEALTFGHLIQLHREDAARRRSARTGQPLRPATLRNYDEYARTLRAAFDPQRPAAGLRRAEVRELIQRLRDQGWAEGTIARLVDHILQVYKWAVTEAEILDADPIHGVKRPTHRSEAEGYTTDEGRSLLTALDQRTHGDWRFRVIALLEACYGVRAHQAILLRWDDVDLEGPYVARLPNGDPVRFEGTITFRQATVGSKGQKDRTVPLLPTVRSALVEALNRRRDDTPWVAWNWRDSAKPVSYDGMQRALHRLERRAGVVTKKGRAFHAFRRALMTAITETLSASHAAAWTGDTVGVVVSTYVRPSSEAEAEAAKFVEGMMEQREGTQPRVNRTSSKAPPRGAALRA